MIFRYPLILLLCIVGLSHAPAQSVVPDSLKRQLAAASGTQQADVLNKIADLLLEKVPDTAYVYAGKAHNFAYILGYKPGMALARKYLGFLLLSKGSIDESVEQFSGAILLYRELKSPADEAECYRGLGDVAVTLSRFNDALPYYGRAMAIADSLHDILLKGKFLIPLANCYQQKGDPYKARETYQQALSILEGRGDERTMGQLYTNLGSTYITTPDSEAEYKRGIGYLLKSIQIRRLIGDKIGLAQSSNTLAFLYASRKDYAKAFEQMNESMAVWTEVDNKEKIAYTHYCLADIYLRVGAVDGSAVLAQSHAQENLQLGLELARKGSFRLIEIGCMQLQCHIQALQGQFIQAEEAYPKVLGMMVAVKDTQGHRAANLELATVRDTIGDLFLRGAQYSDAVPYYQKAAEVMVAYPEARSRLLSTYKNLALCAGKSAQPALAKQYSALYKTLDTQLKAENKAKIKADKEAAALARAQAEANAKAKKQRESSRDDEEDEEEEE